MNFGWRFNARRARKADDVVGFQTTGDGRVVGQNWARRRAGHIIDLLAHVSLFFQLELA
jgi:hypothetical protein